MISSLLKTPAFTVLFTVLTIGCATVLSPEYGPTGRDSELPGPIMALAGEGEVVIAANPEGVHVRSGDGAWKMWDVPGIRDYTKVTALAISSGEVCIGTDGEGLHIFKDGTWEVKTARYGGLPDDSVWSIAYDGDHEGLPGENLWIGTGQGVAVRSGGAWSVHSPGEGWLTELTGDERSEDGKTYLGSGYRLGAKGEDSKYFRGPVTAIGVGPDRIVLGNADSSMAIVAPFGVAVIFFPADAEIMSLLVERGVIWAGTNGGLVWGGLEGAAIGTPWPSLRLDVIWRGRLFGTRNSMPFQYRWHVVGYNTARVPYMSLSGNSLWVVYGKPDRGEPPALTGDNNGNDRVNIDVRRFLDIKDYIQRKEAYVYESYGKNVGISGYPTTALPLTDTDTLWVGTTRGLYRLEK